MHGDMDIVDPLVDDFLLRLAASPDPVEAEMRRYADEREGFPIVGPVVGQYLQQLAASIRARRVFELGSGFGYSAFWLARALEPGGRVTLTDLDRDDLERARSYLRQAGLVDRCRFEAAGDAIEALAHAEGPFDLVFIDIEKSQYPRALAVALPKVRSGGLIVADNVLWGGSVARGEADADTAGLREYIRLIFGNESLLSTLLPLRDGVAVTLKR